MNQQERKNNTKKTAMVDISPGLSPKKCVLYLYTNV